MNMSFASVLCKMQNMTTINFVFFCTLVLAASVDAQSQLNQNRWYDTRSLVLLRDHSCAHSCTGALIHSQWILTSAVCALKLYEEEMRITFGDSMNTSFSNASLIQNVYIHPEFNSTDLENDIALLALAKAAERTIRILKIPQYESDLVASSAAVLGYPQLPETSVRMPECYPVIHHRSVVIINNELCEKYPVNISKNRLCSYKSVACKGDEGAPLVSAQNYTLVGLVSVQPVQAALCELNYNNCMMPVTTYTKVVPFRDWIKKVTRLTYI